MNKNKYKYFLFLLCLILSVYYGCQKETVTVEEGNGGTTGIMLINNFLPSTMPNDSFKIFIYCLGMGVDVDTVDLKISKRYGGYCTALDTTLLVKTRIVNTTNNITDTLKIKISDFALNCRGNDTVYDVSIWSHKLNKEADKQVYVRGKPYLFEVSAGLELMRMDSIRFDSCFKVRKSVDSTFNNPNYSQPDSNQVHVRMDTSIGWTTVPTIDFEYINEVNYVETLDTFYTHHRESGYKPYTLIVANRTSHSQGNIYYPGVSYVGINNWSYVFTKTIDIHFTPPRIPQTGYNYTACHELLHQIGNLTNDIIGHPHNDHDYHAGKNELSCALHNIDVNSTISGYLRRKTGFFRICDYHIFRLRQKLGGVPMISGAANFEISLKDNFIDFSSDSNSSTHTLKMKLAKKNYKMYEPILTKFELINNNTKSLDVYGMFSNNSDEPNIIIKNDKGKTWNDNKIFFRPDVVYTGPSYILEPKETLYVSMTINNWGEKVNFKDFKDNNIFFNEWGYLPPGNYEAYYKLNNNRYSQGLNITSDTVRFTIQENSQQDKDILNFIKNNNLILDTKDVYETINTNYPNNSFKEYISASILLYKYNKILYDSNYKKSDELKKDYENYIQSYPESYYLLNDRFLTPYIFMIIKNSQDIQSKILEFKNKTDNKLIEFYLTNLKRIENIKSIQNSN